jgi:DNA primase
MSCPNAPFTEKHKSEIDSHPSFHVTVSGKVRFKCYSCKIRGGFEKLQQFFEHKHSFNIDYGGTIYDRQVSDSVENEDSIFIKESFVKFYQQSLPRYFFTRGFTREDAVKWEIGYDEKNLRVYFPVRNYKKKLVGAVGRGLDRYSSRYYNYYRFKKEKYLYGEQFLLKDHPTVICEGPFDCVRVKSGVGSRLNVLSLMGSTLSHKRRLRVILKFSEFVYLMMDNDDAGKIAKAEIMGKLENYIRVVPVSYPKEDPAKLTKEEIQSVFKAHFNHQ